MATKEVLEAREADCSTPEDYVVLAKEALAEPADEAYAKDLLEKGELECQLPLQYLAVADAAQEAGLAEYAGELYEQAEDACFEAAEFAALGRSLGAVRGDKDKAREILEKAAEEAKSIADHLQASQAAREGLGDEELATSLLEKVVGDCKTLDDYKQLASSVIEEAKDKDLGRTFYAKAESLADDLDGAIAFAGGAVELFEDKGWAKEVLGEVESDCQFTQQLVSLAGAHHQLTGDADKVGELMAQAEEFAMTGEEQLQLAEGAWKLLGDREKARGAYEKALGEIGDKDVLLGLATTIATELEDKDLAKQVFAKAEEKLIGVADTAKLARAVKADLGDETLVSEVFDRAEQKFGAPADAAALARESLAVLGDKARAERLFTAGLEGMDAYADLGKLLATVREDVGSQDLNRAVVAKLAAVASNPKEFLGVADQAIEVLEDKDLAAKMLDVGEERVTTLPEMKDVVAAVERLLPDDADRAARVKEKLEKREANQGLYTNFQDREAKAASFGDLVGLTGEMMTALDDRYYAAKLLQAAETRLEDDVFVLDRYRDLLLAVQDHIGDASWIERLLDAAASRTRTNAETRRLAAVAVGELEDTRRGSTWVRSHLEQKAEDLTASEGADAYDFAKLAGIVGRELGDADWSRKLLAEAETRAASPFALRHVAEMFIDRGDKERGSALLQKAFDSCTTGNEAAGLVTSLRRAGMPEAELRAHYARAGETIGDVLEKIRWAEGTLPLFGDEAWAREAYDSMKGQLASKADRTRLAASRAVHLRENY